MGFPQNKVNRVLLGNWGRLNNDLSAAIEMLLEASEAEEEKKEEVPEVQEPNLKKVRSNILKQRDPNFNEDNLELVDDNFLIKQWISKTLFIKPQSRLNLTNLRLLAVSDDCIEETPAEELLGQSDQEVLCEI